MDPLKPIISPLAKSDLNDIWSYIAEDSIRYADEVIDDLEESINALNGRPGMGRKRPEFSDDESLSFWPVRNYLIVYRSHRTPIEIVRVLHTSRDIPAHLD